MKLRSRETYWLLKNGIVNAYPSLRQSIQCKVLVVGGGITGSLMAYQLCADGYDTVLIDKRDVALGSTSATTALLQYEIDEPLYKLKQAVGEQAAIACYRKGVAAIDELEQLVERLQLDCGFQRKASLYLAHDKEAAAWLRQECESRSAAGIQVRWCTAAQLWEEHAIRASGAIRSAAAASVDGYSLSHGLLAKTVSDFGLRIYDHTGLHRVKFRNHKNHVLTDTACEITADFIVYATGYESTGMLREKTAKLISTYALVSEPLENVPGVLADALLWDTQRPYLYARSTDDNRVLIGGGDVRFKDAERRDRLIEKKEKELLEKFGKVMPDLSLIPDFSWAGTFGVTKDALPYIGPHPDYPQSFFVLGFGGNGITFSVMGMEIIADALAGRTNKFLDYFRFKR